MEHGGGDEPLQVAHVADIRLHADGPLELIGSFRMGNVIDHDVRPCLASSSTMALPILVFPAGDNGDFAIKKA